MPYETPQANLPRFAPPVEYVTQDELTNIINNLATQGINYRIVDNTFQFKNPGEDTWHTISIAGLPTEEVFDIGAGE